MLDPVGLHRIEIEPGDEHTVAVDPRLPKPIQEALAAKFPVALTELVLYPTNYACPSAVFNAPDSGEHFGITDVMSPWSGAVAEDAVQA